MLHIFRPDVKSGNEHLLHILDREIEEGIFFSHEHAQSGDSVIVLGNKAAQALFPQGNAYGNLVTIAKQKYRVIGIIKNVVNYWGAADPNLEAFVPFKTAQKKITEWRKNQFHTIVISCLSKDQMPLASNEICTLLRIRRNINPEDFNDFMVHDSAAMAAAAAESSQTLNIFLLFIASISLLVAGVGVMNIMLVSVTERTREIGLRLALGATDNLILRQFLFEALLLCLVGGILGILVGFGISHLDAMYMGWSVIITPGSIIASCGITCGIGLFFGYYPAVKASRLDPIIALAEH